METPLKGLYQEKNILTAYQAIRVLSDYGYRIDENHIRAGFRNVVKQTGLMGRWQVIAGKPRTICDVGHNEAGIRMIIEQLAQESFDKLHWVFGMVNDKDADGIMELLPRDAIFYFCKANIPRGLDTETLRTKAKDFGLNGKAYPSVQEAFRAAQHAAGDHDLVFVGGSTFVVAEVL